MASLALQLVPDDWSLGFVDLAFPRQLFHGVLNKLPREMGVAVVHSVRCVAYDLPPYFLRDALVGHLRVERVAKAMEGEGAEGTALALDARTLGLIFDASLGHHLLDKILTQPTSTSDASPL